MDEKKANKGRKADKELITLFVDPAAAPSEKRKLCIITACADIGVNVDFVPQRVERTISWCPSSTAPAAASSDILQEVMVLLEADEAVKMIYAHVQVKRGETSEDMPLTKWVESVQGALAGQNLTLIIIGLHSYFSKQKLTAKQQHRELVSGKPAKGKKKTVQTGPFITTQDAEDAFVDVQVFTGCVFQEVATDEELATQIKHFTKSVKEKPKQKDRLDGAFSFLEQGAGGLNVNKNGQGLSKVWKHQLMQFRNFSAGMSEALVNVYPSPQLLYKACQNCNVTEAERLIGEINVRRSAGVISTNRKIGKEHSRRIHSFMIAEKPDHVIK